MPPIKPPSPYLSGARGIIKEAGEFVKRIHTFLLMSGKWFENKLK